MPTILAGDFNSLPIKTISDAFDEVADGTALISGAYQLLTQGLIESSHQDHPASRREAESTALESVKFSSGGLKLASTAVESWGKEPPFTTKTPGFSGTLDYIFYTPEKFDVVEMLEMPYKWEMGKNHSDGEKDNFLMGGEGMERKEEENSGRVVAKEFDFVPDEVWPSDHLAMGTTFRWKD